MNYALGKGSHKITTGESMQTITEPLWHVSYVKCNYNYFNLQSKMKWIVSVEGCWTLHPVTFVWGDQGRSSSGNKCLSHHLFVFVVLVQNSTDHYITHSIGKSNDKVTEQMSIGYHLLASLDYVWLSITLGCSFRQSLTIHEHFQTLRYLIIVMKSTSFLICSLYMPTQVRICSSPVWLTN